ncbi:cation transporter [Neorhizobium sp. JUb45]|uniref:cation diffusion facilitator family transporter n=1 Tax=unclassified Neorhizobium TaxID=2629175 RepID=UPI00104BDBEC|nr:cation transporter [Neorhizobium sp. JUb45]TCR04569.1 putative Co/Zn/Cd cation transporter (cation efflux family) [Neorhizobium sp. JUb45]
MSEQSLLRLSIAVTAALAAFGITVGLVSGSFAIVFDGFYSLTDAFMTLLALLVSKLIIASSQPTAKGRLIDRFSVGFWHLEPMVLGLNGTLLMGAAIYAFISAVGSLMAGGRPIDFGPALIFTVVTVLVSLVMWLFCRRANRSLKSGFIALDAQAWGMTAALTSALLIAFGIGHAIEGTEYTWLTPYIDPGALALICLIIAPVPLANVRQAVADILLVTPPELKNHVDAVAQAIVERHGFLSYRAYVARVGRGKQIELFFIAPSEWPARHLSEWDAIRDEIGDAIGDEGPDRWLTIVFTSDPEWAD